MIFDTYILDYICKRINDPKTFLNYSLISKKLRDIVRKNKNDKMNQFSKKHIQYFDNECGDKYCIKYKILPNGKRHGKYSSYCSYLNIGDNFRMYYNGIVLAYWYHNSDEDKIISHYKCDCRKEFSNDYTNSKINLTKHKISSTRETNDWDICKTCGKYPKIEIETWANTQHLDIENNTDIIELFIEL